MLPTLAQAQAWAISQLTESDSAAADARVLLSDVISQSTSFLFTWPEKLLTAEQWHRFKTLVESRRNGEPVAYLTGSRDFWTLTLLVSHDTLIPRPETELLVELALQRINQSTQQVCDLGTGTGAVALAVASEWPHVMVTGVDCVEGAVKLAQTNAKRNNITNVRFCKSNWFEAIDANDFDLILSNPPYVEEHCDYLLQGDVRFEPRSALTAGDDGLDAIRKIISLAPDYLASQGFLLIEHGYNQGDAVRALFTENGFVEVQTYADLAGHDRVTLGRTPTCD